MRKMTIKEAKMKISDIYPDIEILNNEYNNEDSIMKLKCNKCGHEWETKYYNLVNIGCTKCNERKRSEERLIKIKETILNRYDITILSVQRTGYNEKVKCKCSKCGDEWEVNYNNLRDNGVCKNCNEISRNKENFEKLKKKMHAINPHIEVLNDIYYGMNTVLKLKCDICGYEWESINYNIKDTCTCKHCVEIKRNKDNFNKVKNKIYKINPNIEILNEDYFGCDTSLHCKCKICNHEWHTRGINLTYKKTGCPMCKKCGKLSLDIIKERVSKISPNIEILSTEYINTKTHLDCKCKVCNYEWKATPSNLQKERGCPVCKKRKKYTLQEIKELLFNINPNIEILSTEYEEKHKPLDLKCKVCNHEWTTSAHALTYSKTGCPSCSGHLRHTQEDIVQKMYEVNPNLEVIGEYTTIEKKLKMRCKICNNEWEAKAYHLVTGASGCPQCASSKGEERIYKYLSENNIAHKQQNIYEDLLGLGGGKLKFDFAVINDKDEVLLQIEYQGEQHYKYIKYFGGNEGFAERVYHDALKQAYCQDNNIPLLIIPFWDYNKIEEILQNTIREYITDLPPNTAINT